MWIDPTNGKRILFGYDQGAIVSLDGGDNWSSWYNQSTEQVYHVATDNSFPYWIYATQQDAGAIATLSRGNLGAVTTIDWKPVPGWEWGTILPNPRDANEIYSSGLSIAKIRYPSGEWINIGPDQDPSLKLRASINLPIAFATWHGRQELLAGYQQLMATADGGITWSKLSPDLTVSSAHPASKDTSMPGSLWSIAPSIVQPAVIWAGTSNASGHRRRCPLHPDLAGGVALRREDCVRRIQPGVSRRPSPIHLPHPRLRKDVDKNRERLAGGAEWGARERGPL